MRNRVKTFKSYQNEKFPDLENPQYDEIIELGLFNRYLKDIKTRQIRLVYSDDDDFFYMQLLD